MWQFSESAPFSGCKGGFNATVRKSRPSGSTVVPGEAAHGPGRVRRGKRYSGWASVLGIQTGVFWKVLA